jgi:hypothetical protein
MKTVLIIVGAIISAIILFLGYSGLFESPSVTEKTAGNYQLVFEEFTGPYREAAKLMDSVYYRLLNEDGIETTRGFGLYYDDPKQVPEAELRSEIGCILEVEHQDKIEELRQKYNIRLYDMRPSVVMEFPFRNRISIFIGIFKVYPKLEKYMTERGYGEQPVMEIYDWPNRRIFYIMPIVSA